MATGSHSPVTETPGAEDNPRRRYKQRLVVHVLWHPGLQETRDAPGGKEYAEHLYSLLTRDIDDSLARGIGIPVYFRTSVDDKGSPPPEIELDDAHHTVVVVLVDAGMVLADGWGQYVVDLGARIKASNQRHGDRRHRLLVVMFSESAFGLDDRLNEKHFIRLFESKPEARLTAFSIGVVHESGRPEERPVRRGKPATLHHALRRRDDPTDPARPVAPPLTAGRPGTLGELSHVVHRSRQNASASAKLTLPTG
jgi:hypothetical protein